MNRKGIGDENSIGTIPFGLGRAAGEFTEFSKKWRRVRIVM